MLAASVEPSLAESGCPEGGDGLVRVGEVGMHPSPHECRQDNAERSLGGPSVFTGQAEVRQVPALREGLESAGEAAPHPQHLILIEVGDQAFGDDRHATVAAEARSQARDARWSAVV
jgi:hypothetical protein